MRARVVAASLVALLLGAVPANASAADVGGSVVAAEVASAVPAEGADPASPPAREGASLSATVGVTIGDNFYDPATVTVDLGDTITWTNEGAAAEGHTVTGPGFDSGVIEEGGTYSHQFTAAGVFDYLCALHDEMAGTVVVRAPGNDGGGGGGNGAGEGGGNGGGGGTSGTGDGGGNNGGGGGTGGPVSESEAVAGNDAAGTSGTLPATGGNLLAPALAGALLLIAGLALRRRSSWS